MMVKVQVAEAVVPQVKQSEMGIAAHLVPGKTALALLTPDRLKALAFISTYSTEDPQSTSTRKHGYQREPMAERFPGIGRYYAKGENRYLIPTLMASVRVYEPKARTRFNKLFNEGNVSKIHQEFGKSAFSIVDGQHRVGGLFWAWNNIEDFNAEVPVMLVYGLNYSEEANLFDDINTNQRKLPKALIEATKVHTESSADSHAQTIREAAFALAEDGDSVWKDKVNITGAPHSGMSMTFEGLRRSLGSTLHEQLLSRLTARGLSPSVVGKRYWELVSKACYAAWSEQPRFVEDDEGNVTEEPANYRLKELVGVAAVSKLGADILATALDQSKGDEEFWDKAAELVSKLGTVDWEKRRDNPWVATSSGFGGQKPLYSMLYDLVYLDKSPGVAVAADEN